MLSDDEKLCAKDIPYSEIQKMTKENIKDLIAIGFDMQKTYIFSNMEAMG